MIGTRNNSALCIICTLNCAHKILIATTCHHIQNTSWGAAALPSIQNWRAKRHGEP